MGPWIRESYRDVKNGVKSVCHNFTFFPTTFFPSTLDEWKIFGMYFVMFDHQFFGEIFFSFQFFLFLVFWLIGERFVARYDESNIFCCHPNIDYDRCQRIHVSQFDALVRSNDTFVQWTNLSNWRLLPIIKQLIYDRQSLLFIICMFEARFLIWSH